MRHVEFIGLSGSGKSTLCRRLTKRLAAEGSEAYCIYRLRDEGYARWSALRRQKALARWLREPASSWRRWLRRRRCPADRFVAWQHFVRRHPEAAAVVSENFVRYAPTQHAMAVQCTSLMHLCPDYIAAQSACDEGDVLLLDEGFFHQQTVMAALGEESPDVDRLAAALRTMPAPDLLVWVHVEPAEAERRMASRGGYGRILREVDPAERLAHLERWDACIRAALNQLNDHVRVLRLDNALPIKQMQKRLGEVAAQLGRRGGAGVAGAGAGRESTTTTTTTATATTMATGHE